MADDILYNSPALHALKRQQLVSLSKRYGLRASGKNEEIIGRLQEYASTLTPSLKNRDPTNLPTPGLGDFATESTSPRIPPAYAAHTSRPSDTWEVLSESNASMISPDKGDLSKSGSVSSWKSAGNGQSMSEFGEDGSTASRSKSSRSSSMKAFANMTRRASVHLLSRSHSTSSGPPAEVQPSQLEPPVAPSEPMELVDDPPSPASTVGVPRRHSTISLLQRPSTLRLVSPPPILDEADRLPFSGGTTNLRMMKERRSMAPIRAQSSVATALNRKSMPALSSSTSASVPSIYPTLEGLSGIEEASIPPLPGSFEPTRVLLHKESAMSISNQQFEDAGKQVLAEMEAKMKAHLGERATSFGQELLKGKSADLGSLVRVNSTVGSGWGLTSDAGGKKDRYAEAHAREFKRMQSIDKMRKPSGGKPPASSTTSTLRTIVATPATKRKLSDMPSAPNGAPLEAVEATGQGDAKRKRLSFGPNAVGSLRGAGRSLVNVIGDMGVTPRKPPVSSKKPLRKRRSSITTGKGRGLAARFGFFNRKRPSVERAAPARIVSNPKSLAPSNRPPSSAAPRTKAQRIPSGQTSRKASTTGSTVASSSRVNARPRLPEFGGASSTAGSVNSLGLPLAGTVSSTLSSRKQSQAEIIRKARPAPAPPSASFSFGRIELDATGAMKQPNLAASVSSINKRTSTLLQPTASSMARMQATVKPNLDRPLPSVPKTKIATAKPFGQGSSRADSTFDTSFNVAKPSHPPSTYSSPLQELFRARSTATLGERTTPKGPRAPLRSNTMMNLKSPGKSPGKASSVAGKRTRDRAGGMSSIKARGGPREMEGAQRRAEIRAKQERLGEERELREMLGDMGGTSH